MDWLDNVQEAGALREGRAKRGACRERIHIRSIKEGERLVGGELWESLEARGEREEKES